MGLAGLIKNTGLSSNGFKWWGIGFVVVCVIFLIITWNSKENWLYTRIGYLLVAVICAAIAFGCYNGYLQAVQAEMIGQGLDMAQGQAMQVIPMLQGQIQELINGQMALQQQIQQMQAMTQPNMQPNALQLNALQQQVLPNALQPNMQPNAVQGQWQGMQPNALQSSMQPSMQQPWQGQYQ